MLRRVKGICGYGRYDDDREHVGCPRARSDMTPCIARDGGVALADDDDRGGRTCVGCGIDPWDALVELKKAARLTPPVRAMGPDHHADQLCKVVRRVTGKPGRTLSGMTDEQAVSEIPGRILRMHPYVDPGSWVKLSEHRYRAVHPNADYAVLAVDIFGEVVARGVLARAEQERDAFADLIDHAARSAAHRVACAEGVPLVRPANEANAGVAGRCWWCGSYPQQHQPADA